MTAPIQWIGSCVHYLVLNLLGILCVTRADSQAGSGVIALAAGLTTTERDSNVSKTYCMWWAV